MKRAFRAPISTALAMSVGLIVLVGYFWPLPLLRHLVDLALLPWAVVLAAVALWVGLFSLISVHWKKVQKWDTESLSSLVLVLSALATLSVGLIWGPGGDWAQRAFQYIQIPVETSLMAILAVTLAYATIRLFSRRMSFTTVVFLLTVLLVLLGSAPLPFGYLLPFSGKLREWILGVLSLAGARGILLGVGLGTVATAWRILVGSDRPYQG